jgi:hypothetical protein
MGGGVGFVIGDGKRLRPMMSWVICSVCSALISPVGAGLLDFVSDRGLAVGSFGVLVGRPLRAWLLMLLAAIMVVVPAQAAAAAPTAKVVGPHAQDLQLTESTAIAAETVRPPGRCRVCTLGRLWFSASRGRAG